MSSQHLYFYDGGTVRTVRPGGLPVEHWPPTMARVRAPHRRHFTDCDEALDLMGLITQFSASHVEGCLGFLEANVGPHAVSELLELGHVTVLQKNGTRLWRVWLINEAGWDDFRGKYKMAVYYCRVRVSGVPHSEFWSEFCIHADGETSLERVVQLAVLLQGMHSDVRTMFEDGVKA